MEGIWVRAASCGVAGADGEQQQVLTNKDLDLPTQQELLAQFRCDEIAAVVVEGFLASSKAIRRPVESGSIVDGLGSLMRDWLSTAMGMSSLRTPLT